MGTGRIIGAVLALVAGAMILMGVGIWITSHSGTFSDLPIIWNTILAAVSIVGGILGILGKASKIGGILALIAGVLWIVGDILYFTGSVFLLASSLLLFLTYAEFTYIFAIESVLAIVGGILLFVTGDD